MSASAESVGAPAAAAGKGTGTGAWQDGPELSMKSHARRPCGPAAPRQASTQQQREWTWSGLPTGLHSK